MGAAASRETERTTAWRMGAAARRETDMATAQRMGAAATKVTNTDPKFDFNRTPINLTGLNQENYKSMYNSCQF